MKKVLSLVLSVVLVVGLGAVAFGAQEGVKINVDDITLGISGGGDVAASYLVGTPNVVFHMYHGENNENVTKADVALNKIDIAVRKSSGANVIGNVVLGYDSNDNAIVTVPFASKLVSVNPQNFIVNVYPRVNKVRSVDKYLTFKSSLVNETQPVVEGQDYVYLGDVHVAEASGYSRNVEVDLGNGVSIHTHMFSGRKYYGNVAEGITPADEALFVKYPDLMNVLRMETVNLAPTGDVVELKFGGNLPVYTLNEDKDDLVYVGHTGEKLPYYETYFIAAKELEIEEVIDEDKEPEEEGKPEDVGPTGGDEEPENVNDNPGTGR